VDELLDLPFNPIITVCDITRETCPMFPGGGTKIHQPFDNQASHAADAANEEEALSHYRRMRDEIRDFVAGLPGLL
jgi:arsenate reductase